MTILCRKYNKGAPDTAFILKRTGKPVCRLDAKLSREDWEQIHSLIGFVYSQGVTAGSNERAARIREALGFEEETTE